MEADLILKIPLSPTKVEDKLIWPHVPNGVYTVKSGYRFLVKDKPDPLLYHPSQGENPSIWSRIWRLSVPKKVKNFLWKACKEALPVKKNLVRRRVLEEDVCCHCKLKAEDGYHALWDCSELSAIWETDVMWLFCKSKKFSNFFELARFVLEKDRQPELFASITWTIWFRRNQLRTSNKPFPLSQIISSAKQMLQEFTEVHLAAPVQNSSPQQSRPKWEPPPPSLLKINFDGAVFRETEEAGLGVVVRDSHGQVLASLAEKIKLPSSSEEVEALAAVRDIFQIFLSLQDSCWRMTDNQSCLRRSRGRSGFARINFEQATSHSRYPRLYRQLSKCFRSLPRCIQQLQCRILLLNSLGQSGNPLLRYSLRLILMVQSSEKQRKLG